MSQKKADYKEEECWSEYEKHKNEIPDFNAFREIYLMESINELHYVAVDSIENTIKVLKSRHEKNVKSFICQLCPVYVYIGDHDWMEIHIRELNIQKSLLTIILKYIAT